MPPKNKAQKKKIYDSSPVCKENHNEKEDINLETYDSAPKLKREIMKSILSQPKQEKSQKAGFWSRKLKDFELKNGNNEKENCSLYEFDGTEGSESYKKKKKSKKKGARRKNGATLKCNKAVNLHRKPAKMDNKISESQKKVRKIHSQSLFREQIMINREREKLEDKGQKFTFSVGIQSLGVTSTPALNKHNLIGASNFLFLSPIISIDEESKCYPDACTPLKSKVPESQNILPSGGEVLKADLELKNINCRRVLRSGKIINT